VHTRDEVGAVAAAIVFATLLLVALANDRHGKPKALHELVGISVDSTKLPFADFAGKVHLDLAKSQSY
jgi:hypothetical protein